MILPIIVRRCLLGAGAERPFAVVDRLEVPQPEGEKRPVAGLEGRCDPGSAATASTYRPGVGSSVARSRSPAATAFACSGSPAAGGGRAGGGRPPPPRPTPPPSA